MESKQEVIDPELMAAVGGERVEPDTQDLGMVSPPETTKSKPRARRKPAPPKEETVPLSTLEKALETIARLEDRLDKVETGMATVIEEPTDMLDESRPYLKHRSIGRVYYEQSGKEYDGAKRLIEE